MESITLREEAAALRRRFSGAPTIDSPHYGTISSFMHDYFGRGDALAGHLFLVFFIYAALGVFWYSLFTFIISPAAILDFQNAVNGITFIVSTIYIRWIAKSWDGYNDGPRQLMDINARICQVYSTIVSLWIGRLRSKTIRTEDETPAEKEHRVHTELRLANIFYLITDAQVFYTLRMFMPRDEETYRGVAVRSTMFKHMGAFNDPPSLVDASVFPTILGKDEMDFHGNENLKLKEFQEKLVEHLSQCEVYGILSPTQSQSLLADITPLTLLFGEACKKAEILEPVYQERHINLILIIYFGVCTPISYYTASGGMIVYVYPILTFIFTAFYFIRNWLGNPFDPRNPMGVAQYSRWRLERREALSKNYSNLMDSLGAVYGQYYRSDEYLQPKTRK